MFVESSLQIIRGMFSIFGQTAASQKESSLVIECNTVGLNRGFVLLKDPSLQMLCFQNRSESFIRLATYVGRFLNLN